MQPKLSAIACHETSVLAKLKPSPADSLLHRSRIFAISSPVQLSELVASGFISFGDCAQWSCFHLTKNLPPTLTARALHLFSSTSVNSLADNEIASEYSWRRYLHTWKHQSVHNGWHNFLVCILFRLLVSVPLGVLRWIQLPEATEPTTRHS